MLLLYGFAQRIQIFFKRNRNFGRIPKVARNSTSTKITTYKCSRRKNSFSEKKIFLAQGFVLKSTSREVFVVKYIKRETLSEVLILIGGSISGDKTREGLS